LSPFLAGITWLLVFQCLGEALVRLAVLPIPGPVAGMVLLLIALLVRGLAPDALSVAGDGLAKHLSLLFVPAGVGVMQYAARLETEWLPIGPEQYRGLGQRILTTSGAELGLLETRDIVFDPAPPQD